MGGEPQVSLLKHIEVPLMIQKCPNSDIKFMVIDEIGILNIFLDDKGTTGPHVVFNRSLDVGALFLEGELSENMFFEFEQIEQTFDRIEQMNVSALVHVGRLHDPSV